MPKSGKPDLGARRSNLVPLDRDCFAEPVLGLAEGKTRGLAMTPRGWVMDTHVLPPLQDPRFLRAAVEPGGDDRRHRGRAAVHALAGRGAAARRARRRAAAGRR